jgi:hypothetical protein
MSQHAIIKPGLILKETNQESTMNEDTQKTEMSLEELAAVTGGGPINGILGQIKQMVDQTKGSDQKPTQLSGGQNDPAQMFQQIMQQLTGQQ